MNPHSPTGTAGFRELALHQKILTILDQKKIATPTPIQHQAIPAALDGKDIVGIAQTGTGKTWAFGLPMLQRLAAHGGRGLVILPTRELAAQVEESLFPFAQAMGIGTAVFVGGASMVRQREMLRCNPRILIATPGRLNDHLEQGTVTLKEVKVLVLDEADRMLDMGFKPQIDRILRHIPTDRQTMLFSATMPHSIMTLATSHMRLPLRIEVAPAGTAAANVEQELFIVQRDQKLPLLAQLLTDHLGTVLVFSRTKHGAKKIARSINGLGHKAAEIHSNRSLSQRKEALDGFKSGRYRVLVATDIAARGIDVTGITVVINFDLPDDAADYVHRIGRTARAGREGRAISIATPDQTQQIRSIERLIRTQLKRAQVQGALPIVAQPKHSPDEQNRQERSSYGSRAGGFSRHGGGHRSGGGGGRSGGFRGGRRGR